jgi:hypothetical protein
MSESDRFNRLVRKLSEIAGSKALLGGMDDADIQRLADLAESLGSYASEGLAGGNASDSERFIRIMNRIAEEVAARGLSAGGDDSDSDSDSEHEDARFTNLVKKLNNLAANRVARGLSAGKRRRRSRSKKRRSY